MDAERWRRARDLFDKLVDSPSESWVSRLAELSPDDAGVRGEALALLRADLAAGATSLGERASDVLAAMAEQEDAAQQSLLVGQRVGAYVLVREIGRGGMGTVWLGERADGEFEHRVAIKLIRQGWDAADAIARFRTERQILAGLTHPNIAHLVDGGVTAEGLPWLALEYVDGVDLRGYCDERTLSLDERLRLFLTVCDAVSHAHARLVVHRDLKPSNLLVTATGQVKLLDFGIAKLVDAGGADVSATRVFTPEYAAPEQVRGEPITTSVDVYALGLLLYELLTGRRPYKLENSTPAAYERAILDQEPTRPSQAAARDETDASVETVAARRHLTPQRLRAELRGDLDAIVLKALRKQQSQRYASVAELAGDIERHLERRPVTARRGGWRYHASRFVRRHAVAVGFAFVAFAALGAGLAVALWQADAARVQRDLARNESEKARESQRFMLDIFRSADPAMTQGRQITAEELLQKGVERIERRTFTDASMHSDLLVAMGEAYLGVGNTTQSRKLFEQALALQGAAGDVRRRVYTLVQLARSHGGEDDAHDAERTLAEATKLLPADAAESELAADLYVSRGINRMTLGDITGSIADISRGVEIFRRLRGPGDDQTASAAITLSWAYDDQDRLPEARVLLTPIVAALRAAPDTNPVRLADALDALANSYTTSTEAAAASAMRSEALAITRRVYGDGHKYVAIRLNNLAFSLLRQHDYTGANAAMKEAVALRYKLEQPGSRRIGSELNNLASTEFALGNWAEAERLWTEALEIRRKGTDITDVAFTLTGIAGAAREQGRLADARVRIDEAVAILRAHPSPKPTHLARTLIESTEVDLASGVVACAGAEEAVALMRKNSATDDPARLYAEVVAAGCAWRSANTRANRDRAVEAQRALRAEFPPSAARVRQADRYAIPS